MNMPVGQVKSKKVKEKRLFMDRIPMAQVYKIYTEKEI